jgi:hypothetical protein
LKKNPISSLHFTLNREKKQQIIVRIFCRKPPPEGKIHFSSKNIIHNPLYPDFTKQFQKKIHKKFIWPHLRNQCGGANFRRNALWSSPAEYATMEKI